MPLLNLDAKVMLISIALLTGSMSYAQAQDYPNRPIRIITGAPGGGTDFTARLVAQGISGPLGQQAVVDNRGNVTGEVVSNAAADGYTLLIDGGSFWIGALMQQTSYDPIKDFAPIAMLVSATNLVVVHPSVTVSSIPELISMAKAKPGGIDYGSGGFGASNYLAAELFKSMANVNFTRINYKGAGPAVTGLLGGEVQIMFVNVPSVMPHVKSGRLKALAVTSLQPSALAPGVPTVAATVPGYEAVSLYGAFAPAKTPDAIITRLNQEIVKVLNRADVKQKFLDMGVEVVASTPQHASDAVKAEMSKWGKILKDADHDK